LQINTPSKQQNDQTTNHTKKKNINQANTPSTQKSTIEPIPHNPTIPPILTSGDQIKTAKLRDHRAGPTSGRVGRKVLARIDGTGSSHQIVDYLHARAMSYSVGFTLPHHTPKLLELIPDSAWTPA
jgi:hypothetical protein